jgi:cytochrome c biogenesis protein CcmG/thiol:disulfide interchange protein DsbE
MPGRLRIALQAAAVLVVALLLALLGWKVFNPDEAPDAGRPAPNFTLPHLNSDEQVSLASFRGKAIVLNFWASWCGPCKDEAPILTELADSAPKGVVYVGLDYKDPVSSARAFARTFGLRYALGRDGDGRVGDRFGVTGMPETFVIDAQGRAVAHIGQPIEGPDLQRAVEAAVQGA